MASTVRVSARTYRMLHELAAATGKPLWHVLDEAVEQYRRACFFAELRDAYARLAADPAAWTEEVEERSLLDATLVDGLDDL
jgi:predicted transcriptional regulator